MVVVVVVVVVVGGGVTDLAKRINSYRADNSDSTVALRSLQHSHTRDADHFSVCFSRLHGAHHLSASETGVTVAEWFTHRPPSGWRGYEFFSSIFGSGIVHAGPFQFVSHLGSHIPSSRVELLCAACL